MLPRTRCPPLPLVGRGWGWGSAIPSQVAPSLSRRITPSPTLPHKGGGSRPSPPLVPIPFHANVRERRALTRPSSIILVSGRRYWVLHCPIFLIVIGYVLSRSSFVFGVVVSRL